MRRKYTASFIITPEMHDAARDLDDTICRLKRDACQGLLDHVYDLVNSGEACIITPETWRTKEVTWLMRRVVEYRLTVRVGTLDTPERTAPV